MLTFDAVALAGCGDIVSGEMQPWYVSGTQYLFDKRGFAYLTRSFDDLDTLARLPNTRHKYLILFALYHTCVNLLNGVSKITQ